MSILLAAPTVKKDNRTETASSDMTLASLDPGLREGIYPSVSFGDHSALALKVTVTVGIMLCNESRKC